MESIDPILNIFTFILNLLSILVLIFGVAKAGYDFFRAEWKNHDRLKSARMNNFIKNYLGSYVLLSLEILIAADIIESIINPTLNDVLRLGLLVIIRTIISYFLHKEIEDSREDTENIL